MSTSDEIITFWLGDAENNAAAVREQSKIWYHGGTDVDETIQNRFACDLRSAEQQALNDWQDTPRGQLALVILLDQFSRNLYRASAAAFKNDLLALEIAEAAVSHEDYKSLPVCGQAFLFHPFHHAENIADQNRCIALYETLLEECHSDWREHIDGHLKFAREHCEIVRKFGRFPHRNEVLRRQSTPDEQAFLEQDARTYGQ